MGDELPPIPQVRRSLRDIWWLACRPLPMRRHAITREIGAVGTRAQTNAVILPASERDRWYQYGWRNRSILLCVALFHNSGVLAPASGG